MVAEQTLMGNRAALDRGTFSSPGNPQPRDQKDPDSI
jgi:hypothetical protein